MWKTLYNNYKYFPVQYVINQATNDTKIKLVGYVWKSLLQSFRLLFVQYFSVEFPSQGQLAPESNTYESWYYAVALPGFVCLALLAQSSLYLKNNET